MFGHMGATWEPHPKLPALFQRGLVIEVPKPKFESSVMFSLP